MTRPVDRLALAEVTVVVVAQVALGLIIAHFGPTHPIPMHFGLGGQVDRWGDRAGAATIAYVMAAASAAFVAAMQVMAPSMPMGENDRRRTLRLAESAVLILTTSVCVTNARLVWGPPTADSALQVGMGVLSLIFALLGAWSGKVGPNPVAGVRTPWTRMSRLAWDRSNRLMGRLLFWGGLSGLICTPFAPQPLGFKLTIVAISLASAAAVFESWRVWRTDPDRTT